jgi:4-amino-4-deoxy-L-arabinose transferase-like glycosyltransferase
MIRAPRQRALMTLVALMLLGAALRLTNLGDQSLWRDEAIALTFAREPTLAAVIAAVSDHELHPPAWYVALHITLRVWGDSEFALRLWPAFCGILLIPAGYALGTRLFDPIIGLLNALLMCVSPFLLRYSQEGRPYTLLALLATVCLYAAARWLQRPRWRHLAVFALIGAGMLYTHNWGFFLLAAINLYALIALANRSGRPDLLIRWLAGNALIGALYLPWLPTFIRELGYDTGWMSLSDPPGVLLWQTLEAWTAGGRITGVYLGLAALGAAGVLSLRWPPLRLALSERAGALLLLLVTCLVPLLIALALSAQKPLYKPDRYTIIVYPAFSLLLAAGIGVWRYRRLTLLAALLLAALWLRKDVTLLTQPYKSTAREAAAYVAGVIQPSDVLVFAPDTIGQSFNYYFRGPQFQIGFANWSAPASWHIGTYVEAWRQPGIIPQTLAEIDAHLPEAGCVFLVFTPGPVAIPGVEHHTEVLAEWLGARYRLTTRIDLPECFEQIDVARYCRDSAADGPQSAAGG